MQASPIAYDQTLAGCEAIAEAVNQTRAAVEAYQAAASKAFAEAAAAFQTDATPDAVTGSETQASDTGMHALQSMAQSLEQAQSAASQSMAVAMSAVGSSAGAGLQHAEPAGMAGQGQQSMANLEQATLQAVQGMTSG